MSAYYWVHSFLFCDVSREMLEEFSSEIVNKALEHAKLN